MGEAEWRCLRASRGEPAERRYGAHPDFGNRRRFRQRRSRWNSAGDFDRRGCGIPAPMSQIAAIDAPLLAADLQRQLAHWLAAARTFRDAEEFASLEAWRSVERDTGAPLRTHVNAIVEELVGLGET